MIFLLNNFLEGICILISVVAVTKHSLYISMFPINQIHWGNENNELLQFLDSQPSTLCSNEKCDARVFCRRQGDWGVTNVHGKTLRDERRLEPKSSLCFAGPLFSYWVTRKRDDDRPHHLHIFSPCLGKHYDFSLRKRHKQYHRKVCTSCPFTPLQFCVTIGMQKRD